LAVERVDRRGDLLAAAEQLFRERGYSETRMVDIADAAGVAKSLAYWYFESKEALFLAVVTDIRERLQAAEGAAVEGIEAPLERIYLGSVVAVKFVVENIQLYGLISLASHDPAVAQEASKSSTVLAADTIREVTRGQADGSIRTDEDPAALAHGNQGVVSHFAVAYVRGQLRGNLDEIARMAGRFVVYALAATPEHAEAVLRSAANTPRIRGGSRKK
jgi:AcrR family transcriptional regulator